MSCLSGIDRRAAPDTARLTRRQFVSTCGAALAATALPVAAHAQSDPQRAAAGEAFRFLFMPDFHLRRDRSSPEGMTRARGRPTMLFGHYPPVTAIEFFNGEARPNEEHKRWELGFNRATRNPHDLVDAIGDARVQAFFSGHIRRLDQISVKGQRLICAGSVSGDQWRGPDVDTEEGFAVVDCRPDGSFDYRCHEYGWDATSQR